MLGLWDMALSFKSHPSEKRATGRYTFALVVANELVGSISFPLARELVLSSHLLCCWKRLSSAAALVKHGHDAPLPTMSVGLIRQRQQRDDG